MSENVSCRKLLVVLNFPKMVVSQTLSGLAAYLENFKHLFINLWALVDEMKKPKII